MQTLMKFVAHGAMLAAVAAIAQPAAAESAIRPVCAVRNASAAMASNFPIDLPPFPTALLVQGKQTIVKVDVDAHGNADKAEIVSSSGWQSADTAAQRSVLTQAYHPAVRDCAAVASSALVTVLF